MNNIFSDCICIWVAYYQVLIQILTVYLFFNFNLLLLFGDSVRSFGDSVKFFEDSVRSELFSHCTLLNFIKIWKMDVEIFLYKIRENYILNLNLIQFENAIISYTRTRYLIFMLLYMK